LLCSFFQVCADIIMFRIIRCGNFVMVLVHKKLYLNATAILIASSLSLSHTHTHTHTHIPTLGCCPVGASVLFSF
jgi:hypothetical protein